MRFPIPVKLLLSLACCLPLASKLHGQPGPAAPKVGDNRRWGIEPPHFQPEQHMPGGWAPAGEVRDRVQGGPLPGAGMAPPQVIHIPNEPPPELPDIAVPTPFLPPPPQVDTGSTGAMVLFAPLAGLLAAILGSLARQPRPASEVPPQRPSKPEPRPFVRLGADGKGGIMYRRGR